VDPRTCVSGQQLRRCGAARGRHVFNGQATCASRSFVPRATSTTHDGRFATLDAVVAHQDDLKLGLTEQQKRELVEYLESL
jgi:hypothetical protein